MTMESFHRPDLQRSGLLSAVVSVLPRMWRPQDVQRAWLPRTEATGLRITTGLVAEACALLLYFLRSPLRYASSR